MSVVLVSFESQLNIFLDKFLMNLTYVSLDQGERSTWEYSYEFLFALIKDVGDTESWGVDLFYVDQIQKKKIHTPWMFSSNFLSSLGSAKVNQNKRK